MGSNQKEKKHMHAFARIRPFNKQEIERSCMDVKDEDIIVHQANGDKTFTFDKVFGMKSKQCDIYKTIVIPIIEEVMQGYNCTVFAYGQTGSGKTHTMIGEPTSPEASYEEDSDAGIIPRTLDNLFEELSKNKDFEYTVRVSYLELYNEILIDLLSPEEKGLKIYEDPKNKGTVQVHGLEEVTVYDKNQVYDILRKGSEKRSTALTALNVQSSRSHAVFSITVHSKEITSECEEIIKSGKLYLVDLAGSENISKSGAVEKRAREAGSINQSLLTLGRVIKALVEKSPHIPYRESKLTRILQDSLGGTTITSIIATVSPASSNLEETLNTLDYAFRARNITNRPEVNERKLKSVVIQKYLEEIDRLKKDVQAARSRDGIYVNLEKYDYMIRQSANRKDELLKSVEECALFEGRVKELERVREELEELYTGTQNELTEATQSLKLSKDYLKKLRKERRIHQELIDKYDEAQTILWQHTTALSSALDSYLQDHQLLRSKVKNLYSVIDTNENASKQLINKCEIMWNSMSNQFEESIKSVECQFEGLQNVAHTTVDASKTLVGRITPVIKHTNDEIEKLSFLSNDFISRIESVIKKGVGTNVQNVSNMITDVNAIQQNVSLEVQKNVAAIENSFANTRSLLGTDLKTIKSQHQFMSANINHSISSIDDNITQILKTSTILYDDAKNQIILSKNSSKSVQGSLNDLKESFTTKLDRLQGFIKDQLDDFHNELAHSFNDATSTVNSHNANLSLIIEKENRLSKVFIEGLNSASMKCAETDEIVTEEFRNMHENVIQMVQIQKKNLGCMSSLADELKTSIGKYSDIIPMIKNYSNKSKLQHQIHHKEVKDIIRTVTEEQNVLKQANEIYYGDVTSYCEENRIKFSAVTSNFSDTIKSLQLIVEESQNTHNKEAEQIQELLRQFVDSFVVVKSKGDTPQAKHPVQTTVLPKKVSKKVLLKFEECEELSDKEQDENKKPLNK